MIGKRIQPVLDPEIPGQPRVTGGVSYFTNATPTGEFNYLGSEMLQDWLTGDEVWSSKALEKGTVTIADGLLYCLTEDNETVALAEASPKRWEEHSRFQLTPQSEHRAQKGKVWTPPVIADGRLYLRDQENLFCYDVKGR